MLKMRNTFCAPTLGAHIAPSAGSQQHPQPMPRAGWGLQRLLVCPGHKHMEGTAYSVGLQTWLQRADHESRPPNGCSQFRCMHLSANRFHSLWINIGSAADAYAQIQMGFVPLRISWRLLMVDSSPWSRSHYKASEADRSSAQLVPGSSLGLILSFLFFLFQTFTS